MAKVNLSTLKTPYWKNARTKEYGEKARSSYLRISKRGRLSPQSKYGGSE